MATDLREDLAHADYHIVEFRYGLDQVGATRKFAESADAMREAADWEQAHPGSVAYIASYFEDPVGKPRLTTGTMLSVVLILIGAWRHWVRWFDTPGTAWPLPILATAIVYWAVKMIWPIKGDITILTERGKGVEFLGDPELRRIVRATYAHRPGRSAESQEAIMAGIALAILLSSLAV